MDKISIVCIVRHFISILFYIKIREHKLLEISKSKCVFLESESVVHQNLEYNPFYFIYYYY